MKRIRFGLGLRTAGGPFEQGRAAALDALAQTGREAPALALLYGWGHEDPAAVLRGARDALGACPLAGLVSPALGVGPVAEPQGVQVMVLASGHLWAKVGVGRATQGVWEETALEAFQDSFIPTPLADAPDDDAERRLYRWYLYRRPSLALAAAVAPDGAQPAQEARIASFLRRRLHGRVPLLQFSPPAPGAALVADAEVVGHGIVVAMIKTDLKLSLERFHCFEPMGAKLFVTRAAGDRVLECNGVPALEAYHDALGLDPAAAASAGEGLAPFSLFPLAHRGRDGRFHLLLPEAAAEDGSLRFRGPIEVDRALYPMKTTPASDLWLSLLNEGTRPSEQRRLAAAVLVRDGGLRDLPDVAPFPLDRVGQRPVEVGCGRHLTAFLGQADTGTEAGHLLLTFERELDPVAVAAADNERLLTEVMQLKDLHQKIFDSIGFGIAVVDVRRQIVFCNNTQRELLTGAAEPLEGRACPWSGTEAGVCGSCCCEEAIARQEAVNREVVRVEEGKARTFRIDAFPLRDVAGRVTAAVEVMRDVTAFKDLRYSLESEQRKMEAVIRGMGETLYIVNARYDLLFFHRGVFPVAAETAVAGGAQRCHQALFNRSLPCPWCRMQETVVSGSVERRVATVGDDAGQQRSYQITFSPWGVGRGEQAAVVCLLVDISAQKRMERQLVLSEKLNSLSILSAGMAHELNNPLGAINFNLEILKRRESSAEYQEVLESIRKDVLRINRIVSGLLSFSRSGAASFGWVAVPEVVDAALELFQVVIERRKIQLRRAYAADLPGVWGNAQDLQQVFVNLIANAVDAMPSGGAIEIGADVEAARAAEREPTRVAIVYDDAGDLDFLRTVTEVEGWQVRFFRGDEEAIDAFRQDAALRPEALVLDFADTNPDRVDFLVTMVKDFAPEARVLIAAASEAAGSRWANVPGVAGILPRPLERAQVLERVRDAVAGQRTRRQARTEVVVRFGDTGVGIPPEIAGRIFDPFYTTKEAKGTGLGLSVVHKILENHGATVQVASTPGSGTTFTIRFPQGQSDAQEGQFKRLRGHGFGRPPS